MKKTNPKKIAKNKQQATKEAAEKARLGRIKKAAADAKEKQLSPKQTEHLAIRKKIVEAVQRGEQVKTVARVYGVAERSVFRYLSAYHALGEKGLVDGPRSGRPSKLKPEIYQWLHKVITSGDPRQLHFEYALWTLALIRMALIATHGITLHKSTIGRILAKMGLSPQVPIYKSYKQDPAKVKYFIQKKYPKLRKWADESKADIFFADESRVRADQRGGTTWAKIGKTPVVRDSGERFGINMVSAVSSTGALHFGCFEEKMDSAHFIDFLKTLRKDNGRPVLVIVDNGSYHKSKVVKEFLKEHGTKLGIRLAYLPPYSPELNPDEQVWNQAKAMIKKRVIKTRKELQDVVERTLQELAKLPAMIRSFFQMQDTRYASKK